MINCIHTLYSHTVFMLSKDNKLVYSVCFRHPKIQTYSASDPNQTHCRIHVYSIVSTNQTNAQSLIYILDIGPSNRIYKQQQTKHKVSGTLTHLPLVDSQRIPTEWNFNALGGTSRHCVISYLYKLLRLKPDLSYLPKRNNTTSNQPINPK